MLEYRDELAQRLSVPSGKSFPDPNNNGKCLKTMGASVEISVKSDKYSLRPRSTKREDDQTASSELQKKAASDGIHVLNSKSRQTKPKQKQAPLSKYRRKTANARERSRMREINQAFEALRRAVPHMFVAQCPGSPSLIPSPSEKLTKITTLRLAMRYISALSAALDDSSTSSKIDSSSLATCADSTQHQFNLDATLFESSDAESLCTLSDNSFTFSDQPLTSVEFVDMNISDDASMYFGDQTLSLDFSDPSLSPDFSEHSLELKPFDPFLPNFS